MHMAPGAMHFDAKQGRFVVGPRSQVRQRMHRFAARSLPPRRRPPLKCTTEESTAIRIRFWAER